MVRALVGALAIALVVGCSTVKPEELDAELAQVVDTCLDEACFDEHLGRCNVKGNDNVLDKRQIGVSILDDQRVAMIQMA